MLKINIHMYIKINMKGKLSKFLAEISIVCVKRMLAGRAFHVLGPQTRNNQSPCLTASVNSINYNCNWKL